MSKHRLGALVAGIAALLIMIGLQFYTGYFAWETSPEVLCRPPVERVYTPSECTVEVSNHVWGDRVYGYGVLISRNSKVFVLTSTMIFTEWGDITVKWGEMTYEAEPIYINRELGLVALQIDGLVPTVELNFDPSIPPGIPVVVGGREVNTLEYINDDWVLLDGSLPIHHTGMPVTQNGEIIGIIVGLNIANQEQSIMASNHALNVFANQVSMLEVPPLPIYLPFEGDIHQ